MEGVIGNLSDMMQIIYVFIVVMITSVCAFVKSHPSVHLSLCISLCKFYLNI